MTSARPHVYLYVTSLRRYRSLTFHVLDRVSRAPRWSFRIPPGDARVFGPVDVEDEWRADGPVEVTRGAYRDGEYIGILE